MPYIIDHKGPKNEPVRLILKKTGKVLGYHQTEEQAKAQIAAIEANKHKKDKSEGLW